MKITKLIFSFWTNKTKFILATVLATIFGLLISIFTMKFSFPDESAHYLRAVEVGHGHFLNGENNIGVPISCDDYLVIAKPRGQILLGDFQNTAETNSQNLPCTVSTHNTAGAYSPLPYLFSSLGVVFAEKIGFNIHGRLIVGRIFNSLVTSFIGCIALFSIIRYRALLTFIFFMPGCLWIRSSLSADSITILIVMCYLIYLLRIIESGMEVNKKNLLFLSLFGLFMGLIKPVYGILAFTSLVLFRPSKKNSSDVKRIILLSIPGLIALLSSFIWIIFTDPSVFFINHWQEASPKLQINFLTHNPIAIFKVLFFISINTFTLLNQLFIPILDNQLLSSEATFLCGAVLLIALFLLIIFSSNAMSLFQRLLFFCISSIVILGIILCLYLSYTRVGSTEVLGVSGRYFIPPLFFLAVAFSLGDVINRIKYENLILNSCVAVILIINTLLIIKIL